MSIRPSVGNVSPRPTNPTTNDGNSSAAQPAAPDEQPQIIRGNRHALLSTAPECVKDWAAGKMPTTAAAFNTCVGWLVRNGQHEGLRDLLSSPKCSSFDTLDLHGEPLDSEALGVLAHHLDRSSVTKLDLSGCHLESRAHADAIAKLLGPGSKLALLNLSHNKIGDMAPVCNALSTNRALQHLNLRDCGLNARNHSELLRVLCDVHVPVRGQLACLEHKAKNQTLQTLCLADNELVNPSADIESLEDEVEDEDEVTDFLGQRGPGRSPSMRWLDLSNTGITLSRTSFNELRRLGCPRLDLARNRFTDETVRCLIDLQGVTHLNLQGVSGGATRFSALGLVSTMHSLRVLDLRGAHPDLLEIYPLFWVSPSLVCLRLDPEVAARAVKARPDLTPLSSGDLLGPAGGFLASWSPPGLSAGIDHIPADKAGLFAKKLDEELDVRSIASLLTVNRALSATKGKGLEQALRRHTDDPSFDWDAATMIAAEEDTSEAEDVSESPPVSVLTTTTSLTATTTTTTTTDLTMTSATTGTGAPGP